MAIVTVGTSGSLGESEILIIPAALAASLSFVQAPTNPEELWGNNQAWHCYTSSMTMHTYLSLLIDKIIWKT